MFINLLFKDPHAFITIMFLVVFSVCCHEFMHAFVALMMGDDTAARSGHLTLNPLKQMGWFSLLMMLFIGIAWGQVPVNRAKLNSRWGRCVTALAGPLTNLLLWLVFIGLCLLTNAVCPQHQFAVYMLLYGAVMKFVLFVFNILPVPGLDGFSIMIELFPCVFHRDSELVKGVYFLMIAVLFMYSDRLFNMAMNVTLRTLIMFRGGAA